MLQLPEASEVINSFPVGVGEVSDLHSDATTATNNGRPVFVSSSTQPRQSNLIHDVNQTHF